MRKLLSCAFNIDTGNVEPKYSDGSQISIYCQDVKDSVETTIRIRAEMDWLIYNTPLEYISMALTECWKIISERPRVITVWKTKTESILPTECLIDTQLNLP